MGRILHRSFHLVVCGLLAAACGASAPARFYTIEPKAEAGGGPAVSYGVAVMQVSVPAVVDRPQFVLQVAPNRVEIDEFNRWAAPLGDNIADALVANLATILQTPNVATAAQASFAPDFRLTVNVQQFESVPGESVTLEASWSVTAAADRKARSGRTTVREPVDGPSYEALAAAHSRALARLSEDIAARIRTISPGKR